MKAFVLILLVTGAFALTGCESDMPPDTHRENPLQRGMKGEGKLVPLDESGGTFDRDRSSQ